MISLLAPREPEPRFDMAHVVEALRLRRAPTWLLLNMTLKRAEWERRQRWHRRLLRRFGIGRSQP